jgi:hypothetical protein
MMLKEGWYFKHHPKEREKSRIQRRVHASTGIPETYGLVPT